MPLAADLAFILTKKTRARYIGYVGYGNLGDEALYVAIAELFSDHLEFCSTMNTSLLLSLLGKRVAPKVIFLGGGTLIKGPSMHLARLNHAFRVFPQARFVVFGTGVEDASLWERMGYGTDKEGWRKMLARSDYIAVRGPLSKTHLQTWGVEGDIHVIGDPCMWFARDEIVPKRRSKRVGLNLGPSGGNIHGQDEGCVLEFGAHLLRRLLDEGWLVTLFPVIADDVGYMMKSARMAGIGRLPVHTKFLDLRATLNALEDQDVFIGEKLHSVVFSHCVYTPAIMLEYRTKCRDFMQSIGREGWTFRTDALDVDLIMRRLNQLHGDLEQHQKEIYAQVQRWKFALQDSAAHVKAILSDDVPGAS